MFNPAFALGAAVIWAFSPIYYRDFLRKFEFLNFNLLRTGMSAAVLLVIVLVSGVWSGAGLSYAVLSGAFTLAIGDSLYLLSIRKTGASIAAPVVYTYVLLIQLAGVVLGQAIPYTNFAAAIMVVAGVYILSRGGEARDRRKGVALALGAALAWTIGQEFVQLATLSGGQVFSVTFVRNGAAALVLGGSSLVTGRIRRWPSRLTQRETAVISFFILSDLVVGSLLYIYSVSITGVALTVIVTSLSPLLTQAISKALGKVQPSSRDFIGGLLIVSALVVAVAV